MAYLIICIAAAATSALTLFSGFGLGTLLLPFFALFVPVDLAVAMTAVVHLLNNLFKLSLLGRAADRGVVVRFGLPALAASLLGAWALVGLTELQPLATYTMAGTAHQVMPVKLVIGLLMMSFVLLEGLPRFQRLSFEPRHLWFGGLLSGFFGGLSGHQGALRSAFLLKCHLATQTYIATGAVIACLVDLSRVVVYAGHFTVAGVGSHAPLLVATTVSAFAGAWAGSRWMKKITMRTVQVLVCCLLLAIGTGLAVGLI